MRVSQLVGTPLILLALAAPASAGFFECRDADGRVMFQDRPCADGMESKERGKPAPGIVELSEAIGEAREGRPDAPERPLVTHIEAPVSVPADRRYVVDHSRIEDEDWKKTLAAARESHGHGTLVRVFLEHAIESDVVQASAGKLSDPARSQGGGRYREVPSGTFLLVEHLDGNASGGRELLELGNVLHGVSKLWLPVAPDGSVVAGGDIVLGRMAPSQMGQLEVRLPPGYRMGPLALGPLVVGGKFGREFECNTRGVCRADDLAPGPYKIQFPKVDAKRARFDAEVEPGKRLILELRPGSAKVIMIVDRHHASLAPASPH